MVTLRFFGITRGDSYMAYRNYVEAWLSGIE